MSDACIIGLASIYLLQYLQTRYSALDSLIYLFIFPLQCLGWPGDGGSLSVQDFKKQSVLRLTQIRLTGLEITVSKHVVELSVMERGEMLNLCGVS